MSKYDDLKETEDDSLWGSRSQQSVSQFLHGNFGSYIIHGYLPCLECRDTEGLIPGGGKLVCKECGTVYTLADYVEAAKNENSWVKEA